MRQSEINESIYRFIFNLFCHMRETEPPKGDKSPQRLLQAWKGSKKKISRTKRKLKINGRKKINWKLNHHTPIESTSSHLGGRNDGKCTLYHVIMISQTIICDLIKRTWSFGTPTCLRIDRQIINATFFFQFQCSVFFLLFICMFSLRCTSHTNTWMLISSKSTCHIAGGQTHTAYSE